VSTEILDQVFREVLSRPESRWEIGVITSNVGSAQANYRLCQQRADVIPSYLIGLEIPASNLTAVSCGSSHPIANNRVAERRARNNGAGIKGFE
jgi:outer membrane protein OmpA-like peptidoglycan-associated protein